MTQPGIHWIFALGFLAQGLFGLRIIVQWWITEKKRQVTSPLVFWKLSLGGSALFLIYGVFRNDLVIIIGQLISYFIYVRNLQLKHEWNKFPSALRIMVLLIPVVVLLVIGMQRNISQPATSLMPGTSAFLWIGIGGQLLLNLRFIYQLYHSEKLKDSILPGGFWWLSLAGSALLVCYAVYRRDPVLLVAQAMAIIPYIRNISVGAKHSAA